MHLKRREWRRVGERDLLIQMHSLYICTFFAPPWRATFWPWTVLSQNAVILTLKLHCNLLSGDEKTGTSYIRWGRNTCESSASLLYRGHIDKQKYIYWLLYFAVLTYGLTKYCISYCCKTSCYYRVVFSSASCERFSTRWLSIFGSGTDPRSLGILCFSSSCCCSCWGQKAKSAVVTNPIGKKSGRNTRRLPEWVCISDMTSYFQDGCHDVILRSHRVWCHWLAVCATVPDP